jgi:hypothetical protein
MSEAVEAVDAVVATEAQDVADATAIGEQAAEKAGDTDTDEAGTEPETTE